MWRIEFEPDAHRLTLRLRDHVSPLALRECAAQHAKALDAAGGSSFHVLVDLCGLFPLEGEAVTILGGLKQLASDRPGCEKIAVLANSPTVALQQSRVRVRDGEELITLERSEAEAFLATSS